MAINHQAGDPRRAVGFGLSLSNEDHAASTLALCRRADAAGFDEVSLPESRQHRAVFSVAAAAMATTTPRPGQDRRRQPGDPTPRSPGDGGGDPGRDRRPGAAGVRRRRRGVDDARPRLRAGRMAPVHEHRRDRAGPAALARRSGTRLHADHVRGPPGHPPRLRPPGRHPRRRRRGERADDGGGRRGRRRRAARRARQPCLHAWAPRAAQRRRARRAGRPASDLLVSSNVLVSVGDDRAAGAPARPRGPRLLPVPRGGRRGRDVGRRSGQRGRRPRRPSALEGCRPARRCVSEHVHRHLRRRRHRRRSHRGPPAVGSPPVSICPSPGTPSARTGTARSSCSPVRSAPPSSAERARTCGGDMRRQRQPTGTSLETCQWAIRRPSKPKPANVTTPRAQQTGDRRVELGVLGGASAWCTCRATGRGPARRRGRSTRR